MAQNKIVGLIVDDHPLFRTGLKNVLLKMHLFQKIHEAKDGLDALNKINEIPIDLVFMDVDMPNMNGVEATKQISVLAPHIKIIAITMFCEPKYVLEMLKSNVAAYLVKDSPPTEITRAIQLVLQGDQYYSSKVQEIIVNSAKDNDNISKEVAITATQKEVLVLLCNQYSTNEIVEQLKIARNTVNRHRQELLDRTQAKNLAGLVIYALKHKIIHL